MSDITLVIGSKRFSSWSLRAWLFLRHHQIAFREMVVPLYVAESPDTRTRILEHSPSGKVPFLKVSELQVWESLAICEFAAEHFHLQSAWPADAAARAMARSIASEMHAGFAELRKALPFDAQREPAAVSLSEAVFADVTRICAIWREARHRFGANGPWLFGSFGIADAMFVPIAVRFHQYAVSLGVIENAYVKTVLSHPSVQDWLADGAQES